ncbi:MAG TPA: TAXI family TRAP transporter solute-binding subunit, partial [Hydrogenophaga sp.]|nr:TAXI family TRAP transporter solute-binding subunit [Hydrogenophaga sp.]
MPKNIRYTLLSLRDLAASIGPFALLTIALLTAAYWWLDPTPPKRVVLATGPEQSAYDEFGKRYAEALKRYGIEVELLRSEGSSANLALLRNGQADLGFVQGGTADIGFDDEDAITSLGSLFVEPLWLFYSEDAAQRMRQTDTVSHLSELRGWQVNVGTPGSGVPRLFSTLLDANRIQPGALQLSEMEQTPATVAFLDGQIDALVFASAPESLMVQMLLQTPGVRLLDFAQSEAYSRRFGYLTPVVLPQGVVDLAANNPQKDVRLVASTTSLLASTDTHPAILQLFAQTATHLHGGAGWFSRTREYPSLEHTEVPVSQEAVRAITSGPPFLQR